MGFGNDVLHLQGPLVLVSAPAFATSAGTGEHPVFDRANDGCAVAAAVGEHVLAPLRSKDIQALEVELLQLVVFNVAQLVSADQAPCSIMRLANKAIVRAGLGLVFVVMTHNSTFCLQLGISRES